MEKGNIVEFDSPFSLINKKEGHFYDLVQKLNLNYVPKHNKNE